MMVPPTKKEIRSGSQWSGQGDELSSGCELHTPVEHPVMYSKQMNTMLAHRTGLAYRSGLLFHMSNNQSYTSRWDCLGRIRRMRRAMSPGPNWGTPKLKGVGERKCQVHKEIVWLHLSSIKEAELQRGSVTWPRTQWRMEPGLEFMYLSQILGLFLPASFFTSCHISYDE